MTKSRDFKRIVRARMAKTGESYATARLHLVESPDSSETPGTRLPETPDVSEYEDLGGMSNDAVEAKTGKDWAAWVAALDEAGALALTHTEIARLVGKKWPDIGGWWAQGVTGGYERIRGLRLKGQNRESGTFDANKSKTFGVPVQTLYAAFADEAKRGQWCGETVFETRTCSATTSVRLRCGDGHPVNAYFTAKGPDKSAVAIQHRELPEQAEIAVRKAQWTSLFGSLGTWLDS